MDNEFNSRNLNRRLDLCGTLERVEKREAIRKQEQAAQQIAVDSSAAVRRGLRSYLEEAYRKVDVERMKRDPAYAFFVLANTSVDRA